MNNVSKHLLIGAAVASIVGITVPTTNAQAHGGKFKCEGGNGCKGKGSCSGKNNSCKGQNGCKGEGFVNTKDEKHCEHLQAKNGHAAKTNAAPGEATPSSAAPVEAAPPVAK